MADKINTEKTTRDEWTTVVAPKNPQATGGVEGTLPTTKGGSPKFASRTDGVEAGIVAGTMHIK